MYKHGNMSIILSYVHDFSQDTLHVYFYRWTKMVSATGFVCSYNAIFILIWEYLGMVSDGSKLEDPAQKWMIES